jgi:hypothetical protein
LVVGIVSGASLISNTSYYTGSYTLARYLTVTLEDVRIANLNPSNTSINPSLVMIFNVKAPDLTSGHMTLTHLSAVVHLNGEPIAYETFQNEVSGSDRSVAAGYNKTFTVGSTVFVLPDKQLLYNASLSGNWTFNIALRVNYILFQGSILSSRMLFFVYEGYTPI